MARHLVHGHRGTLAAPSFKEKVLSINATFDDVVELVLHMNSTIMTVADLVEGSVDTYDAAVVSLRILAIQHAPVADQVFTERVQNFTNPLHQSAATFIKQSQDLKAETQTSLSAILRDFLCLREEVYSTYIGEARYLSQLAAACTAAPAQLHPSGSSASPAMLLQVGRLNSTRSSAKRVQELSLKSRVGNAQDWAPFDWLADFFGRGKRPIQGPDKPPTQSQGRQVADPPKSFAARSSADVVVEQLTQLNSTLGALLRRATDRIAEGLAAVRGAHSDAVRRDSGSMSAQIRSRLGEPLQSLLGLGAFAKARLAGAVAALQENVEGAIREMQPLYAATSDLHALAGQCRDSRGKH